MAGPIRAIIVDDEPLARRGLEIRLRDFKDFEIVAQCANGREAIEAVARQAPDLMFLDIEMPGIDGFEVLRRIPQTSMPMVVFVTAFDRYAIDALAARIGSFLPEPESRRHLSTWLSHDDAVRMVQAALTAAAPGYAVVYGVSANTRGWWDLAPGRTLGYDPQDDAEVHADRLPVRDEDAAEAAHVGGEFATEAFHRPAL